MATTKVKKAHVPVHRTDWFKKMVKTMKARNIAFWKKSPAQQRIAIAKDVIKQVEAKFYKAKEGTYLDFSITDRDVVAPDKFDKAIDLLKNKGGSCNVCGIGSCFVSLVNLGDAVSSKNVGLDTYGDIGMFGMNDKKMRPMLSKVFDKRQLSMIECAFEQSVNYFGASNDDRCNARRFGWRYVSSKNRLLAIMHNIIKNKGDFNPLDR